MIFSFCTTCMNRLDHIKMTMPINMALINEFNLKQKNHKFELSLCNYDSKDDLDDYILNNYKNEIDSKILIYSKVYDKKIFNPGHAKNISHKRSTGDILINIDADNYLNEKFIFKVIELYENNINTITIGYDDKTNSGSYGRICISRNNFFILGGYFENFKGYGLQDYDLYARGVKYLNLSEYTFNEEYVEFISHDNLSRIINYDRSLYSDNEVDFNNIYSLSDLDIVDNIELFEYYIEKNIVNINMYNNIEFGE